MKILNYLIVKVFSLQDCHQTNRKAIVGDFPLHYSGVTVPATGLKHSSSGRNQVLTIEQYVFEFQNLFELPGSALLVLYFFVWWFCWKKSSKVFSSIHMIKILYKYIMLNMRKPNAVVEKLDAGVESRLFLTNYHHTSKKF